MTSPPPGARVLSFALNRRAQTRSTPQGVQPCPPTPGQRPQTRQPTRPTQPTTEDSVIAAERAHLARSREFLYLMRENALELAKNPMAGDRVSLEYLKADLYRRAEALKDLPDAPLFFGRLDYSELARQDEDFAGADFHIGRRHVHDPDGTPVVLDWRAPVSMPFYRASQPEPMGLTLRRRFGFSGGALTAYEDERFRSSEEAAAAPVRSDEADLKPTSNLLITEIERPRSGPMRDIVATIQPEQDDIVRAGRGDDRVRAGRARHRQDGGRPAPGGVPALRAQGAGDQAGRGRRGPEPRLPLLHQERAARAGRARCHPDHGGRPGGDHPHPRHRHRRGGHGQGRRPDGRGPARRPLVVGQAPGAGARAEPGNAQAAGPRARDRGARPGATRPRRPLRDRPRAARAPDRARHPQPARGGRRDLRRPHPRLGPPLRAGPQVRGRGLAEGRSEASGLHRSFRSKSAHIERTRPALHRRTRPHPLAEGPAWPRLGPLDPRRPGADRRGGRSHRAHAVDRARGGGRGAGPVADGGAGDRAAVRDRGRDRARRHRPGHHPVGRDLLAGAAASTWASPTRPCASSTSATGCRGRSSTTRPGCCRRSPPASGRPGRCAPTRTRCPWSRWPTASSAPG